MKINWASSSAVHFVLFVMLVAFRRERVGARLSAIELVNGQTQLTFSLRACRYFYEPNG
jgi:hypothetical protein